MVEQLTLNQLVEGSSPSWRICCSDNLAISLEVEGSPVAQCNIIIMESTGSRYYIIEI